MGGGLSTSSAFYEAIKRAQEKKEAEQRAQNPGGGFTNPSPPTGSGGFQPNPGSGGKGGGQPQWGGSRPGYFPSNPPQQSQGKGKGRPQPQGRPMFAASRYHPRNQFAPGQFQGFSRNATQAQRGQRPGRPTPLPLRQPPSLPPSFQPPPPPSGGKGQAPAPQVPPPPPSGGKGKGRR